MMYVQMYMNVELIKHKAKLCFNNENPKSLIYSITDWQTKLGFIYIANLLIGALVFVRFLALLRLKSVNGLKEFEKRRLNLKSEFFTPVVICLSRIPLEMGGTRSPFVMLAQIFRSAVQSTKENNSSDNFVLSSFPSKYHPQKHTQAFLTPFSIFAVILIESDDAHKV